MAFAMRPTFVRRPCAVTSATRTFVTKAIPSSGLSRSFVERQCPSRSAIAGSKLLLHHRAAAFHTSVKRSILPAEPQHIEGTANDAVRVPEPSPAHGSYHWSFERLVAISLVPLTIAPFAAGSVHPVTDAVLCAALVIHSHIGFESLIIDYLPQRRVPKTRKAFGWALKGATLAVAVGLYEFETNDVGLTEATKRIWKA